MLPVIIAGGGIGGMAAAVGLARKGVRSIVLEQSPQLGEIGAGIQLAPNAFHCFDYLGIGEESRKGAVFIDQLRLMDALTAEEIVHLDINEPFRKRFRNPYAVVHRADLHDALVAAARERARRSAHLAPARALRPGRQHRARHLRGARADRGQCAVRR